MLTIRLKRIGKKNKPYYQMVVAEKARSATGKFIEILGSIDPHSKARTLKKERVLHWLSTGAQPSETAYNILVQEGIITSPKIKVKIRKKKQKGEGGEDANVEKPEAAPAAEEKPAEEKKEEAPAEEKTEEK